MCLLMFCRGSQGRVQILNFQVHRMVIDYYKAKTGADSEDELLYETRMKLAAYFENSSDEKSVSFNRIERK